MGIRLYRKILIGHDKCNWSRWVWESTKETWGQEPDVDYIQRVFFEEWLCPVCGMLGGVPDRVSPGSGSILVKVPEGCLFIHGEQALPQFRRMKLDLPRIREQEAAMKKEDEAIFHAIWKAGCPENCMAVWEENELPL
jgi:hypothetical protein